jgi:hypothetical protein
MYSVNLPSVLKLVCILSVGFDEVFVFSLALSCTLIRVQELDLKPGSFDDGQGVLGWEDFAVIQYRAYLDD